MATKQQFLDFLAEIEPGDSTTARCSSAHNTLRGKLEKHDTFKDVHVGTFLSGSYARDTAVRPRKINGELQRPDVDIIVETAHTEANAPKDVIDQLHGALVDAGYQSLRKNRRSVSVLMTTVDMDVVPIIPAPSGTGYLIPDVDVEDWIVTNPPGHTEWATSTNKNAGYRFKPLVKLLKWWRREHLPSLGRPKGFILETMVAQEMSYSETSYEELFAKLMQSFKANYKSTVDAGLVPYLADPSVPGNNVFSAVTSDEFKKFYDMVCKHVTLIDEARSETDESKQLAKWRKIFGDYFPPAGAGTARAAAGSGLLQPPAALSLAFPSTPVVPKKQQGFA